MTSHPLLRRLFNAAAVLCLVMSVATPAQAFPSDVDLAKLRSEIDWPAVQGAFREAMRAFNAAAP